MEQNQNYQENTVFQNPMGYEPEGKLLTRLAVPMVISMLIQALYNLVDSIFVSRISENALTGVSLAYPIQMLMISVAVGTGVGMNSLISRRMGEGRQKEASLAAVNGIYLMVLSAIAFLLIGIFFTKPFFRIYTDDPEIFEMGVTYLTTCTTLGIGIFLSVGLERIMQAQGKAMLVMCIQLTGAVTNLIFDPIFIFGFFGLPAMGVLGAALATVLGQWFSAILGIIILRSRHNQIEMPIKGFRPNGRVIGEIYTVGVPSIIMQAISTVMNLVMNGILIAFTATAVAVFGVYFKIQSMIFMPVFGMTNAAMSIMAFNYGARNRGRLMRTYKLAVKAAICIMVAGLVIFQLFPEAILSLFDASPDMMEIGVTAMRILCLPFPVAAYCIVNSTFFQALGNGVYSMIVSFMRQMIALVPAAWLLAKLTNDLNAVWFSFPIAEVMSLLVSLVLFAKLYRERVKIMELENPFPVG